MCGIFGFVDERSVLSPAKAHDIGTRCRDALTHRGPDGEGAFFDVTSGVGLFHRRLSVVDLSVHGHQPMLSASKRFALCFNGEIYNHGELRTVLAAGGTRFVGTSDTEVFLNAVDVMGLETALLKARGMFALALFCRAESIPRRSQPSCNPSRRVR